MFYEYILPAFGVNVPLTVLLGLAFKYLFMFV